MFRKLFILSFFTLFLSNFSFAQTSHLVINSFQITGERATDEFVEILNPTQNPVNLVGWRLSKKTASGSLSNLLTTFPEKVLNPGNSIIIGHKDSTIETDLTYSTASSVAADNTIILFSDGGKTVVDKVGFGKAQDFETAPTLNPKASEILERTDGKDTDNNQNDFEVFAQEPESESLTQTFFDLTITEIMPNPKGTDGDNEWIEIKNNGPKTDLGGLILRDKLGSPKEYKIPLGTVIGQGGYAVFYSKETPISLNNDGDIVEIITPFGEVIDSSEVNYETAKEGFSFALFNNTWEWTTRPTPGAANIFVAVPAETTKVKTAKKSTKKTKKKSIKKKGEVLGEAVAAEEEELGEAIDPITKQDKINGIILIAVAILAGAGYTLYVNKEKVGEILIKTRERYQGAWEKIRAKIPKR